MARVTVRLEDGYKTTIHGSTHIWHADEPEDAGGTDQGPSPTEMLLGALGSCISITMKMYAERKKWDLQRVEMTLEVERFLGADYPDYDGDERYVHEIKETITLHGNLDDKQKERLLDIAKRCPVSRIISTPTFFKQRVNEFEYAAV